MKQLCLKLIALFILTTSVVVPVVAAADEALPLVTGEVRKVESKSGKITIRHEPIPNLDMPGMSMVFRVDDGIDISQFRKGETVEFTVVERDGKMVILQIAKVE